MSGIRGRGRPGSTAVPRWRIEDTTLDAQEFRVACWLASHVGTYLAEKVSRNEIADKTGVSAGKVTYALRRLEEFGIIEIAEGQRGRLVITFDFDVWDWSPHDQSPVTTRPLTGHDMTDTREQHSEVLQEEPIPPHPPEGGAEADDGFAFFWSKYPRREAKATAIKAWRKLKPAEREAAVNALERWLAHRRSGRSQPEFLRYCPHPTTWINQRRWEDELPEGEELGAAARAEAAYLASRRKR